MSNNIDILWMPAQIETALENTKALLSRMRDPETGKTGAFVVYTPKYRLLWIPANTAVGYASRETSREARKETAFFDEDGLYMVDNKTEGPELTFQRLSGPLDEEALVDAIFNFLTRKCKLDQLDYRRSCITAERLDLQPYEVAVNNAPENLDDMEGSIEAG